MKRQKKGVKIMNVQSYQPAMAARPNFQGKNETIEKLKKLEADTQRFDEFGNEEIDLEEKAEILGKFADNEKMPKFLKYFLATAAMGLTAFLTGKVVSGRLVKVADKNLKIMDKMSEGLNKQLDIAGRKLVHMDEKGIKAILNNTALNFVEGFKKFSEKGLKPEDLEKIDAAKVSTELTKNGISKIISTAAGAGSAIGAIAGAGGDKDKDGIPNIADKKIEEPPSVTSSLKELAKAATTADMTYFI